MSVTLKDLQNLGRFNGMQAIILEVDSDGITLWVEVQVNTERLLLNIGKQHVRLRLHNDCVICDPPNVVPELVDKSRGLYEDNNAEQTNCAYVPETRGCQLAATARRCLVGAEPPSRTEPDPTSSPMLEPEPDSELPDCGARADTFDHNSSARYNTYYGIICEIRHGRRYGFIRPLGGEGYRVFFHFENQFHSLSHDWAQDELVEYGLGWDHRKGKCKAVRMLAIRHVPNRRLVADQ